MKVELVPQETDQMDGGLRSSASADIATGSASQFARVMSRKRRSSGGSTVSNRRRDSPNVPRKHSADGRFVEPNGYPPRLPRSTIVTTLASKASIRSASDIHTDDVVTQNP